MLDMGFEPQLKRIVAYLPSSLQRQTLMFSATFSADIRRLAQGYLHQPREVEVAPANSTADTVEQWIYPVDKGRKPDLLSHLIRERNWHQVLVFSRTKHGANRLAKRLERDGIVAEPIHGNKSQNARTRALEGFKNGRVQALVATDIAARGLDISGLPQVVNFDLPNVSEDYVHRIGRTGRAGAAGHAYSLVCAEEAEYLQGIERLIRRSLPREQVPGFEPTEALPDSVSRQRSSSDRGTPGKRAAGAGRGDGTGQPRRRRRGRGRGRQNARVADSGQR